MNRIWLATAITIIAQQASAWTLSSQKSQWDSSETNYLHSQGRVVEGRNAGASAILSFGCNASGRFSVLLISGERFYDQTQAVEIRIDGGPALVMPWSAPANNPLLLLNNVDMAASAVHGKSVLIRLQIAGQYSIVRFDNPGPDQRMEIFRRCY